MRPIKVPAVFRCAILAATLAFASEFGGAWADEVLFESARLTPPGEYTRGIEGPAVDAAGVLYVVNFKSKGTIGKWLPGAEKSEFFKQLPVGSIGNGIRFDKQGAMYIADYKGNNVLLIKTPTSQPTVYFHSDEFIQPNDLAIAEDGTLYASDPDFKNDSGRIWRISRGTDGSVRGIVMASERGMNTANGLDLSVDGTTLYVSESESREVWAYTIEADKLVSPQLVKRFDDGELDGLRTDVDGRIFVTRPGRGTVAILNPDGALVREVELEGKNPTNLTFGGEDGRTVYVTQGDGRFIEAFRTDRPGREPCQTLPIPTCAAPQP